MSDTISRQAAIDALEKEKPTPFVNEDGSIDPFGAGQQNQWYRDGIAIMNLPSAQPEIIRCKDCMYWVSHDKRCVYLNHGFAPNMWCCHAERRTDG